MQPAENYRTLILPAFGAIDSERLLAQDELHAVVWDKYPVTPGHALIIPKRVVNRFSELSTEEQIRLLKWVDWLLDFLGREEPAPDGFNLAINDGDAAGQTVGQLHFHVIPRRSGDVEDPRGGVRWVIPRKAKYW